MNAISLFSGVGGFDLGLERAGIETVLQCDLFDASHLTDAEVGEPCRQGHPSGVTCEMAAEQKRREMTRYGQSLNGVLARHWPDTGRVNDVRDVGCQREPARRGAADAHRAATDDGRGETWAGLPDSVDLVYGGFPCQDVSVAGKRAGLGGERSGLWFEFHRVLRELRPRWALIENVPGLLSSNEGRDFAVILDGLDELGFGVAWAVLDAQHFGVPQRRRRLFVVAGPSRRSAEQVLSLCESCGGNPETGRAQGEGTTGAFAVRTANTGANGHGIADDVAHTLDGANGQAIAYNVMASHQKRADRPEGAEYVRETDTSLTVGSKGKTLVANPLGAHHGRLDLDHDTYVADIAPTLDAHDGRKWGSSQWVDNGKAIVAQGVRRLTPLECERLMGWPDDWTRWTADGREIADSHRYRMCGNGVASPVAEWIGHRLMAVSTAATT